MKKHAPFDSDGRDLRIGDWVRVLTVPLSIKNMRHETKEAFSRAVGNTFQIEAFDDTGCMELDMWPKVSWDTIWLEPFCVRRFRRYKRLSNSFKRRFELRSAPRPPRYEVKFDIRLNEGVEIEEFGFHLTSLASSGGFACWPTERRIKGSVYADKSEADPIDMLNDVRRVVAESELVNYFEVSEITEADDI